MRGRLRSLLKIGLGAGLTIAAVLAVLSSAGGPADVMSALERVSGGWSVAAVGAMPVGYALLALHLRRLLRGRLSLLRAVRADLLLFGLGNVLPGAPAPGALLAAPSFGATGSPLVMRASH